MFISSADMAKDKDLGQKLKGWAGALNLAAKKEGAPTFKISGPQELDVRDRRFKVRASNFMGGEEFRLTSVVIERERARDGIELLALFAPVSMELIGEVSSMTLSLTKALDVFDGFEGWVDISVVETDAAHKSKEHEREAVARLPTVEETRASAVWGAW